MLFYMSGMKVLTESKASEACLIRDNRWYAFDRSLVTQVIKQWIITQTLSKSTLYFCTSQLQVELPLLKSPSWTSNGACYSPASFFTIEYKMLCNNKIQRYFFLFTLIKAVVAWWEEEQLSTSFPTLVECGTKWDPSFPSSTAMNPGQIFKTVPESEERRLCSMSYSNNCLIPPQYHSWRLLFQIFPCL